MERNRIIHYCRCLNRGFTAKEYDEWRSKHSSSDIIFSYKGFGFNMFDVCLTPNVPVLLECPHFCMKVLTAQPAKGMWIYGLNISVYTSGHGIPVSYNGIHDCYNNENKAILEALKKAEFYTKTSIKEVQNICKIEGYSEFGQRIKSIRAMLNQILKLKFQYTAEQLTLFNM